MVDRISVVLVSRPSLNQQVERAAAEQLTEKIVGNLAGRPGIDLVLVTPLSDIQSDSTDHLTLSAIQSGTAVLTWSTPTETIAELTDLGIPSVRCPHAGDTDAAVKPADGTTANAANSVFHQIYAFDLRNVSSVDRLMHDLDQIRSVRSVKTFSLGSQSPPGSVARIPPFQSCLVPPVDQKSANASLIKSSKSDLPQPDKPRLPPKQSLPGQRNNDDSDLDALIDSLDDFDC